MTGIKYPIEKLVHIRISLFIEWYEGGRSNHNYVSSWWLLIIPSIGLKIDWLLNMIGLLNQMVVTILDKKANLRDGHT